MGNHRLKLKNRKFILTFCIVILIFAFYIFNFGEASAAVLTKPPTNLGLVGYWSMNENTGTIATDFSGNGNRGILTGGPTWVDGKRGKALSFDANDDLVNVGTPTSLNITGALTISAWIYPRTFGSVGSSFRGRIVDKENDFATGYAFSLYDPNTGGVGVPNDTFALFINASGGNLNCFGNDNSIVLNTWQHVAVTLDSSKNCIPYVNGAKATTTSGFIMGSFPTTGSNSFTIGNNSGNTREFNGSLDEVRVYNRALSASEIQALYKSGAVKIVQTAITKINAPQNNQITNGLVGLWTFNGPDMSGTTAYDRSGQGNNGTLTNGPSPAIGKVGQALKFDGSNDSVNTGDIAAIDAATTLSVSVWVKHASITDDDIITSKGDTGLSSPFTFFRDNVGSVSGRTDVYAVFINGTTDCRLETATNSSPLDTWTHVAMTFQAGSATGLRIYINGVEDANSPASASTCNDIDASVNAWTIGLTASGATPFNGLIDEIRVYNRALSAKEIQTLYNIGATTKFNVSPTKYLTDGLVGYWTMDGSKVNWNTGAVTDSSGLGNTGTITNMATSTGVGIGKIGQALNFDGSNDYVSIPDGIIDATQDYTISAWVKVNDFTVDSGGQRRIVMLKDGSGNGISLGTYSTGNNFLLRKAGGTSISKITAKGYSTGVWYFVAITKTSDTTIVIYINGISDTAVVGDAAFTAGSRIGSYGAGTSGRMNGLIDEVRVYNRALSPNEIQKLYNTGR